MNNIKKEFPIANKITYLDSAALCLKPKSVIDAINYYYNEIGISIRTAETPLANLLRKKYFDLKKNVAKLLDCDQQETILVHNTTDGLNYFYLLIEDIIKAEDELIVSNRAHSANILPLINLAKKTGAKLIISDDIVANITKKTKLVAMSQVTNSTSEKNDFDLISKITRDKNIIFVNDAAQAIAYKKVSLAQSEVICFSANKIFGPTSGGILAIKKELLNKLKPKRFGGGAIDFVDKNLNIKFKESILAHEPGSFDNATIFGFCAALEFFDSLDKEKAYHHIKSLSNYAYEQLLQIKNLEIFSNKGNSIITFQIKNIASQEIANYLGHNNIYVRSGYFCNPILDRDSEKDFVRVSLNIYNEKKDIDRLVEFLIKGGDFLDFL